MGVNVGQNAGVDSKSGLTQALFQFVDQSVVPPVPSLTGIFVARGLINALENNEDYFYYHNFQNNLNGAYEIPYEINVPINARWYGTFTGELIPELSMNWMGCVGLSTCSALLTLTAIVPLTQQNPVLGATSFYGTAAIAGLKITTDASEKGRDRQMVEFRYRFSGPTGVS